MRLNVKAMAGTGALMVGGVVFLCGLGNLAFVNSDPPYAEALLRIAASIYPGYHYPSGFGGVIIGTLYGLLDGLVGGALVAWFYNLFSPKQSTNA